MIKYVDEFEKHYVLDDQQKAEAAKAFERRKTELKEWLEGKASDIEDYFHDLQRLESARRRPDADAPFEQKRNWDAQTKLRGQLSSWSKEIDRIGNELHDDLRGLLRPKQASKGPVPVPLSEWLSQDNVIIYTNLAIGTCLILGLFTRLASLGGALFLLSVVLASPDWPGLYPPPPPAAGRTLFVGKEFIEMMALFALATLPVGRWGGLDFFIHYLIVRPIFGKRDVA
jgi:uncharacterized membrane protein YphA (DoxX/SURF4 family)